MNERDAASAGMTAPGPRIAGHSSGVLSTTQELRAQRAKLNPVELTHTIVR